MNPHDPDSDPSSAKIAVPHNPIREGELQILLRLPGQFTETRAALRLDPHEFRDFQPLPKAREIVFADGVDGMRQEESRRKLAAMISRAVTAHVMAAIEAGDTVNGYTKEENRKFYEGA